MARHIALSITVSEKLVMEILIAQLSAAGANGFEEEKNLLKAFIPAEDYNAIEVEEIIKQNAVSFSKSTIEDRNWNAEWEAGFKPVTIGKFCTIRASFHQPDTTVKHDIIITPKMSFGTGHHATTHMMIEAMATIGFAHKTVFDFGTGTGVLAILAEKLGAKNIVAIDNDEWSITNATENINSNNCHKILIFNEGYIQSNGRYDVILANINRNIILQNMASLKQHLASDGVLLLSGLLTGDEPVITGEALQQKLQLKQRFEMNGWICLHMVNM